MSTICDVRARVLRHLALIVKTDGDDPLAGGLRGADDAIGWPAGQFYPAVPTADRKQIVAAYQAKHGAAPSDAQVQSYYMMGRQKPAGAAAYAPARGPLLPPATVDGPSPAPAQSAQAAPAAPELAEADGF